MIGALKALSTHSGPAPPGICPAASAGIGKALTLPQNYAAHKVYLHFDGVYCNSEVWINGHSLGKRPNGFVSFRYDLTPFLNFDRQNIVAVKVDHSQYADARWYTGSGINRNVWLIAASPVHIKQWGVFVTTPTVTPDYAEVHVSAEVQSHSEAAADVELEHTLYDAHEAIVAKAVTAVNAPPCGELASHSTLTIPHPHLWSVEQPSLYRLQTIIRRDGEVLDEENTPIGLRAFHFDTEQGFFLNGQNIKLKGVCLHDDAGALGTAVPTKVWERRLRLLKAAGVNAIRMAHNPHMPELYDLCDRMGFLVQDEAFDEWERGKNKWIAGWNVGTPARTARMNTLRSGARPICAT